MGKYGVRYSEPDSNGNFSWLRDDGYATMPGTVARAWSGTKDRAQQLIDRGVPIGPATAELLPEAEPESQ